MSKENLPDTSNAGNLPDDPSTVIDNMPPQVKEQLSSWIMSWHSEQRSGAAMLVDKLDAEHISTIITNGAKEDERQFAAFKIDKVVGVIIFILSIAFALALLIIFMDSEYFVPIVTALFSFLGGLGVGKFLPYGKNGK
jgi:hypothetical protein